MALKFSIDKLEDVAEPLREHYVKDGDTFVLTTQGDHPKVAEFRENNVKLMKDLARFEGIDPDVAKADKAKLEELEHAKPKEHIAALETQLAVALERADASVLNSAITDAFLKAGGRGNALGYIVGKATDVLTVENGVVVGKVFDRNRPGEKLTVEAFIASQVQESDFAFRLSSGGGASSNSGGGGGRPGVKELVNPSPQELGQHAAAISRGELKVVYKT